MENHWEEKKIRLLLVDDHTMFREALSACLQASPEWEVVSAVPSVNEALKALDENIIDAVLLDYDLGPESAFDFFKKISASPHATPVVIVTAGISHHTAKRLLASGARGIIQKYARIEQLSKGLHEILAGRIWPEPDSANETTQASVPFRRKSLTHRQKAVAKGILAGQSNKEIAALLGVSESSVKCTVRQLFAIMGARTRSRLVLVVLDAYPDGLF